MAAKKAAPAPEPLTDEARAALSLIANDSGQAAEDRIAASAALDADYAARVIVEEVPA